MEGVTLVCSTTRNESINNGMACMVNYRVNKKSWDGVGLIWCITRERKEATVTHGCLQVFVGTNAYD
jgi:hypothetical protein